MNNRAASFVQAEIKPFENKTITQSGLFENEIGPGVTQSWVQETHALQECQRYKAQANYYASILSLLSTIVSVDTFINTRLGYCNLISFPEYVIIFSWTALFTISSR